MPYHHHYFDGPQSAVGQKHTSFARIFRGPETRVSYSVPFFSIGIFINLPIMVEIPIKLDFMFIPIFVPGMINKAISRLSFSITFLWLIYQVSLDILLNLVMMAVLPTTMVPISDPKLLDLDQLVAFIVGGALVLLFSIINAVMEHSSSAKSWWQKKKVAIMVRLGRPNIATNF